jgi:hypothetical protein
MRKSTSVIMIFLALAGSPLVYAGPFIPAGDLALRHDIQRLADHGVIQGTITTWPLAWAPILEDLGRADLTDLPPGLIDAVARLRERANWETQGGELLFNSRLGVAGEPTRIRSFQNTPRGDVEVSAGAMWLGDWFAADVNVQYVDSDQDDDEFRADDSLLGVVFGNWSIAASTQQRWWGPGWDGSLILGNNSRPFPALTIDRVFTDRFESKWLSWIGPWDVSVMFGQLEKERDVPNAQFFGMRVNFRPLQSLEIGISRSAQWCGDGRPCGFDTFVDLFLGRDNIGDEGIDRSNEPGNQLGGYDIRWTPKAFERSVSVYGQFIGEDEAGGFPSRYFGQVGAEWAGYVADRWSTRAWVEYARTDCDFFGSSDFFDNQPGFNCAYNHDLYTSGYRYRGRSIGHGADNDAELISVGGIMVDAEDTQWRGHIRFGELNRGGAPDPKHTLTPTPQDILSIDVSHSRAFRFGTVDVGVGYEEIDDSVSGRTTGDARFYVQWRSGF